MSNISSIDDLLAGIGNSQQPATPEHKEKQKEAPETPEDDDIETPTYGDEDAESDEEETPEPEEHDDPDDGGDDDEPSGAKKPKEPEPEEDDVDEYGNKKERMSKGMKERLDRKEKQHQREIEMRDQELQNLRQQLAQRGASAEVQQAVKDFKYDPSEEVSWEQQLSDFVKQTVTNMHQEGAKQARERQEQEAHKEFHKKFTTGMERFSDFREVVGTQPIDDAMTLSLRGMADPSAFIYAASKRQPAELERISKIPDPYARMVEMGRLEERMRKNRPITKAPRPLGRTKEDTAARVVPKQKETTGDDLLAKADAKRLNTVKTRHRANR